MEAMDASKQTTIEKSQVRPTILNKGREKHEGE
jgi:hypothetical protein